MRRAESEGKGEKERERERERELQGESEQIFTPPLLALTNLHFLNGRVELSG